MYTVADGHWLRIYGNRHYPKLLNRHGNISASENGALISSVVYGKLNLYAQGIDGGGHNRVFLG